MITNKNLFGVFILFLLCFTACKKEEPAEAIVTALLCNEVSLNAPIMEGEPAEGIVVEISYTGGNGGTFNAMELVSEGVLGLTARLESGKIANGTGGRLRFSIKGTAGPGANARFTLNFGGQKCVFSIPLNQFARVSRFNCAESTWSVPMVENYEYSFILRVPYLGGSGASHDSLTLESKEVIGLRAHLEPGILNNGDGNLRFRVSGIPQSAGIAKFELDFLESACVIEMVVYPLAEATLQCDQLITNAAVLQNKNITQTFITIPYINGNGGLFLADTIKSSNGSIIGTLNRDILEHGAGTIRINLFGMSTEAGNLPFSLTIGQSTCTFLLHVRSTTEVGDFPAEFDFCTRFPMEVKEVINSKTGRTWLDRNLDAQSVAQSVNDNVAWGGLFQWGRTHDNHQCRNSFASNIVFDYPSTFFIAVFIDGSNTELGDWRTPSNANLWKSPELISNPCPIGFRVPALHEWEEEVNTWPTQDLGGAISSGLRLPASGSRLDGSTIIDAGEVGYYWTSSTEGTQSIVVKISNLGVTFEPANRTIGNSVRCIKD